MFLNIVTPCSRPQNLHTIANSINIPRENYRWIVVFDGDLLPDSELIPNNCEIYTYTHPESRVGHYQRNFALDMIESGHVYFNDDDTIIHPELWQNISALNNDFITFNQNNKDGSARLHNRPVSVCNVDSHNFIFDVEISKGIRFTNLYEGDGIFAQEVVTKSKSYVHLPIVLSVYNSLR